MVTCCPGGCKARRQSKASLTAIITRASSRGVELGEGIRKAAHAAIAQSDVVTVQFHWLVRSHNSPAVSYAVQTHDDNTWAKRTPEQGARAIAWAYTSPKVRLATVPHNHLWLHGSSAVRLWAGPPGRGRAWGCGLSE